MSAPTDALINVPRVIIHGGCGAREDPSKSRLEYRDHLVPIVQKVYACLLAAGAAGETDEKSADKPPKTALEACALAARLLEDDPLFNAGYGSRVQRDGIIRMSASVMDGSTQKFAGVMNVENVRYPSAVAVALLGKQHRVLAGEPATRFARDELGMEEFDPMAPHRREEWERNCAWGLPRNGEDRTKTGDSSCLNLIPRWGSASSEVDFSEPIDLGDDSKKVGTWPQPRPSCPQTRRSWMRMRTSASQMTLAQFPKGRYHLLMSKAVAMPIKQRGPLGLSASIPSETSPPSPPQAAQVSRRPAA